MDARRKKVLMVLCVASLILAWRIYAVVTGGTPAAVQANPAPVAVDAGPVVPIATQTASPVDSPALWESQQAVAAQAWGRDPFADVEAVSQPEEAAEEAKAQEETGAPPTPSLRFSGVSSSDNNWLAVVQGNIVRVGDFIDGRYKVVEITKRSLTLAADGWTFRYELGSDAPFIRPPSENP
jgi:hypothetical protein